MSKNNNGHITDSKKLLATTIDNRLKELKLSRQDFARLMGAHASSVTKWLSGDHNFTLETLLEIEVVLGVSLLVISINKVQESKSIAFAEWINKAYISVEELNKFLTNPKQSK